MFTLHESITSAHTTTRYESEAEACVRLGKLAEAHNLKVSRVGDMWIAHSGVDAVLGSRAYVAPGGHEDGAVRR